MQKARLCGIAFIGVRDCGHIGAAGYYAQYAAREGFVTMVTGNDMPSVAAPGSRKAILGSNPLAWAAPNANGHPLLLDIATAAVAGGKVYAAIARGEPLPDTWLIGPDGPADHRRYAVSASGSTRPHGRSQGLRHRYVVRVPGRHAARRLHHLADRQLDL